MHDGNTLHLRIGNFGCCTRLTQLIIVEMANIDRKRVNTIIAKWNTNFQARKTILSLFGCQCDSLFVCLMLPASPDTATIVGDSPNFQFNIFPMPPHCICCINAKICENAHKHRLRLDCVRGFVTFCKMV